MLPKAHVGPSLMIAARILSCSQQEFSEIESLDLTGASESSSFKRFYPALCFVVMSGTAYKLRLRMVFTKDLYEDVFVCVLALFEDSSYLMTGQYSSEALQKWRSMERDSIEGLQPASKKQRHSAPDDEMQQQDGDTIVASAETTDPFEVSSE